MGFNMKSWSNPVTLDSNNLNRIEQGIKNAHDTLEITNEEVSNLQNKQAQIVKDLNTLTKDAPNILDTLNRVGQLLTNNDISAVLSSADNFLMKTSQSLTTEELNQVYKNLKLNSFLKLTSIKVNGKDIVSGSEVNISLPSIDDSLNINSTNAISNKAVAEALKNVQLSGEIPDELADLKQDNEHQTVSLAEKIKWNSFLSSGNIVEFTETDPTVPAWAKKANKPVYDYTEILNTPNIPTNNNQLDNGAGYITEDDASTVASSLIATFKTSTITPITNDITALKAADSTILTALSNKAPMDHTHDDYALTNHNHNSLYSLLGHTHDEYKTYTDEAIANLVNSAPDTMNTLKELADAIEANSDILNALDNTYLKLSGGTMTGPLVISGGDAASGVGNIQLDTNGQITAKGTTATLFGRADGTNLYLGHGSYKLIVRGSETRPTYNGKDVALYSDIPTAYSAVYTGTSSTQSSNSTLSTLRIGFASSNLYIWNS